MPTGCFAPFPVTVPQWGSLTRVGRHIPQAAATAVPSLLAPGASFSAGEAAPRAAGQGRVGPAGLFLELMLSCGVLRRGPEDLLAALRGVAGVWAQVSASGYGLALAPAGTFQGEFKLWSPWEQVPNPGTLHVLLQLWKWPWLGCALPRGTETWGGGCEILTGCSVTCTLGRQDRVGQHNLHRTPDPWGAQRAAGPPLWPAVGWRRPTRTTVALS